MPGNLVCAWCRAKMGNGDPAGPVSHGICLASEANIPLEDLSHVDPKRLDELPFGVIRIVGDEKIVAQNEEEPKLSGLDPAP